MAHSEGFSESDPHHVYCLATSAWYAQETHHAVSERHQIRSAADLLKMRHSPREREVVERSHGLGTGGTVGRAVCGPA
jgi:hypothetical protein